MAKSGVIPPTSGRIGPSPGKTVKGFYPKGRSDLGSVDTGHKSNAKPGKPGPQTSPAPEYPKNQAQFEKLGNSKGIRGK